jgi:hypothetical protein
MSDQQDSIPETATDGYWNLRQLIEQQGVAGGLEVLEQAFRRNRLPNVLSFAAQSHIRSWNGWGIGWQVRWPGVCCPPVSLGRR